MELVFFIIIIIACMYFCNLRHEKKVTKSIQDYIIEESSKTEEEPNDDFESDYYRKKHEREQRYNEYAKKCAILDSESGFPKMNEYNAITVEQERWYNQYVDNFCGIGKTKTKYKLSSLIRKGDDTAKFLKLALEIGDAQNSMIECKRDLGYYGQNNIGKKENAIMELIDWSKEHNSTYGVSFPTSGLKNMSIVYFEYDGFAFACYLAVTKNITALKDINKNHPRIPNTCQEVTVEDILPRLENKILEKFGK